MTGGLDEGSWIPSVGIDVGTSTTKLIVSRLRLARSSSLTSMPRYEIKERVLVYQSAIYETPLRSEDEVDADRLWDILLGEYGKAGIRASDLKSGAVIITGETATKNNARQIVHRLAERSGDFVVAAAGADLEGLLAGKGAGAEERSKRTRGAVCNIDIGGGTANAAFFHRGKPAGTVTFHVGGRLIRLEPDGRVASVSSSLQPWLESRGWEVQKGQRLIFDQLKNLCAALGRDMLDYLAGAAYPGGHSNRALLLGEPPESLPKPEEWTFSGGIGQLMQGKEITTLADATVYGDIGPLLAHELKELAANYPIRLGRPDETVRATVIGAGMQTTEISGATAHLEPSLLPIRNLPVIKAELCPEASDPAEKLEDAIERTIRHGAGLYALDSSARFALALSGMERFGYKELQRLADALAQAYRRHLRDAEAIVILCENDMAKALGQALERRFGTGTRIVCIDQIRAEFGDYVDLGEPISGAMTPVVVKTLAFHKSLGGNGG